MPIAHGIPAVIVGVDHDGQNCFCNAVDLVAVQPRLALHVHATLVDYDFLVRFKVRDTVFDAALPLIGRADVETLTPDEADCFRPRIIRFDRPLPSLRYAVKKRSSLVKFNACSEGFVIDVEDIFVYPETHKGCWIARETPIRAVIKPCAVWRLGKIFNAHALDEDYRLANAEIPAFPHMLISNWISCLEMLHFLAEHFGEIGIIAKRNVLDIAIRRRVLDEYLIDRIVFFHRVVAEPQLGIGRADCRYEDVERFLRS